MQVSDDQRWEENSKNLKLYMTDQERKSEIAQLIGKGKTRLPIDLNKIRELNSELARDIIRFPIQSMRILQPELQEAAKISESELQFGENDKKGQSRLPSLSLAFEGDLGRNFVTPRGLLAKMSNQLVQVQGIVTKMSTVKNKIIKSVHYCKANETGVVREYDNIYNLSAQSNLNAPRSIPTKDKDGNAITMEDGRSNFVDSQTFVLQELPENAPAGLLPRSIEVVMEDDLVDTVKPGDRVEVVGVFKSVATQGTTFNGRLKSILVATNSRKMNQEQQDADISLEDIKNIKEQGSQKDIINRLTNSVAPSIHGHELIKQGILLQLVGGVEKNVEGMHLRGDINILMIGDPSTAKSQMLRYVMNTAPLALNTTGRGSSGVGLTAVVKTDRDTGQRSLEAGAMVLADRGIVCIDELDKMDTSDRVAIHEAMEQQTVTISKAGIHCSLNARCSVIAAANPVYGEYHTDLPPTRNINLPDSLLSRFDLLFIVLDEKDTEKDRRIADRVTRNHSYRGKNQGGDEKLFNRDMIDIEDQDYIIQPQGAQTTQNKGIYQKMHKYYSHTSQKQMYSQEFIQKYIKFCKKINSELTDEAIDYLSKKWKDLRQRDQENQEIKVLPITIRTYETMIRLSTAFAKLRQSRLIQIEDCKNAYNLLRRSLFGDDEDDYSDDDDGDYHPSQAKKAKTQGQKKGFQKYNKNKMEIEEDEEDIEVEKDAEFQPSAAQKKSIKKQQEDLEQTQKKLQKQSQQSQQKQSQQQSQQQPKQKQAIIVQEMKKIRIDDEDEKEVDKILAEQSIASIKVTKEERTQVFKSIGQMLKNTGVDSVASADLWKKVGPVFGAKNKDKMLKCLVELDLDGKIDYQEEDDQIYLL